MKSNHVLLSLAKAAAALLLASPLAAASSNFESQPIITTKVIPYGSDKLENTDFKALASSILDQFRQSKVTLPKTFEQFPDKKYKGRMGFATDDTVVGISENNLYFKKSRKFLDKYFTNQIACNDYDYKTRIAWMVKTDLHEDTHYVSFYIKDENGYDLNDLAFSKINKLDSPQDPESYIRFLKKSLKKEKASANLDAHANISLLKDKLVVAVGTSVQIRERIGDVGSTLYALSNYSDGQSVTNFYEKFADTRTALYYDYGHPTASSVRFAIETFKQTLPEKRTGLSLYETTKWAAQIVEDLPEFQKTIPEIANDIKNADAIRLSLLKQHKKYKFGIRNQHNETSSIAMPEAIINARNASCGVELNILSMR